MNLNDLAKGARPIFCRFEDPGDTHGGVITAEPTWEEDNYNPDREMLVIRLISNGVPYEMRARSGLIETILAAVLAAGAGGLEVGGSLFVTFTELQGKRKIYSATYEPPEDSSSIDSRESSIGTGQLEFGTKDPDDQAPW